MDIILLFLAKPLDKHGTTLVHITYPPLISSIGRERFGFAFGSLACLVDLFFNELHWDICESCLTFDLCLATRQLDYW